MPSSTWRTSCAGCARTPRCRRRALALEVIRDASVEISGSVVFATGVILLVFMPVFLLSGVQGRFMTPLALAFSLSVLASLLVALTVTPALAALLLRVESVARPNPRWLLRLRAAHQRALAACTRAPAVTAIVAGRAAAGRRSPCIPLLSGEFMPTFREGHFVAQVASRVPGTSLGGDDRDWASASARTLLQLPFVATVEQQVGRAEQGEDTWGPERCEFHIELKRGSRDRPGSRRSSRSAPCCASTRPCSPTC